MSIAVFLLILLLNCIYMGWEIIQIFAIRQGYDEHDASHITDTLLYPYKKIYSALRFDHRKPFRAWKIAFFSIFYVITSFLLVYGSCRRAIVGGWNSIGLDEQWVCVISLTVFVFFACSGLGVRRK